jgi:diguanylate cyclase (GGDEF)-like protein
MERIRKSLAANPLVMENSETAYQYTVSIGGAVLPVDADTAEELIRKADLALLKAKSEGRNCSRLFKPEYEGEMAPE